MRHLFFISLSLLYFLSINLRANNIHSSTSKKLTISGYVTDINNGEELIGATVYVKELKQGTSTNLYGFYSLNLDPGKYTVIFSYIGYQSKKQIVTLQKAVKLNIELQITDQALDEIVVTGEKKNSNITKTEMSTVKMKMQEIKKIPALMGEVDVIKAIQLLPGVQSTSEGSSGFSVRGGSSDQNLILLDEASVYNASHLLGFFSVFNNDAIKSVKLYKGDIPAEYGGRLSSLLDIRMKEGNLKKFSGTGGIGTISSRLTIGGPIIKDKTSFILSGRRSYADIFLPLAKDKDVRKLKLYFYDLNLKINHRLNDNNRFYLSSYFGRDAFINKFSKISWGNRTITFRWNHLFSKRLFSNFTAINSNYDYQFGIDQKGALSFLWKSALSDICLKADFNYFANPNNTIRFGFISMYHTFDPGNITPTSENSFFTEYVIPKNHSLEHAIYLSNEQKIASVLTLKYGLRYSIFQNIGDGILYNYDKNHNSISSKHYKSGEIFNTFSGLEPRLSLNYILNETSSIKTSYSRTRQYIQLAQNSTAGSPFDIWFSSSPNVKPQIADQVALGLFKNLRKNTIETSVEVYYKKMQNTIDFRDHAELLLNKKLEGELRFGESYSYGAEFYIRLKLSKLNGWISYTYSRAKRTIPEINNGKTYPATYDKPNDISVVMNYQISRRLTFSVNWIYSTGSPVTFPTGRFEYNGAVLPVYSDRNACRMPDYHRLDLALTLQSKYKPNKKWHGEWNFSVYNAYARKNAWTINFVTDESDPNRTYAEMTYLFSVIPSITYNFHF